MSKVQCPMSNSGFVEVPQTDFSPCDVLHHGLRPFSFPTLDVGLWTLDSELDSPLHASFLGRVDLREVGGLVEEEALDVIEKEILRVRVSKIQPVMVDDLGLFL